MTPPPYVAHQNAARYEETEMVWRLPARSARWRVPALCSAVALLVGLGLGYAIWGGERSAPARAGSPPAGRDAPESRAGDDPRPSPAGVRVAAGSPEDSEPAKPSAAETDEPAKPSAAETDEPAGDAARAGCAVSLTSVPAEAAVLVGGERVGETPLELELPCGEVEFEFRRSRYRSLKRTAVLSAGEPSSVAVRLRRPKFKLEFTSRPSGAKVSIDGRPKGVTPVSVTLSGYTYHKVVVRKSGYRSYRKRIYPRKDGSVRARLSRRR